MSVMITRLTLICFPANLYPAWEDSQHGCANLGLRKRPKVSCEHKIINFKQFLFRMSFSPGLGGQLIWWWPRTTWRGGRVWRCWGSRSSTSGSQRSEISIERSSTGSCYTGGCPVPGGGGKRGPTSRILGTWAKVIGYVYDVYEVLGYQNKSFLRDSKLLFNEI